MRPGSRLEQTFEGSQVPDAASAGLDTVENDILEDVALLDSPVSVRGAVTVPLVPGFACSDLVLSKVWED